VEPTDAAWELLGEAVEDVINDMKRRMKLGPHEVAQAIGCGIAFGLHKATGIGLDGHLG